MKCHSFNAFFETIGNKTRLKIVEALMEKPLSVSELCNKINEEQSKISHNLKILKECHFINVEKEGKKHIYSLNKKTIIPLLKLVEEHVKGYCNICRRLK